MEIAQRDPPAVEIRVNRVKIRRETQPTVRPRHDREVEISDDAQIRVSPIAQQGAEDLCFGE